MLYPRGYEIKIALSLKKCNLFQGYPFKRYVYSDLYFIFR